MNDDTWMRFAVAKAQAVRLNGDAPFGCVIVDSRNMPIGEGGGTGTPDNPTDHSEIAAIRQACRRTNGLLYGCTLYSTLEPCPMCCGAINHAKISRVVWGASRHMFPDLFKARRIDVRERLRDTSRPPEMIPGVLVRECIHLLKGWEGEPA